MSLQAKGIIAYLGSTVLPIRSQFSFKYIPFITVNFFVFFSSFFVQWYLISLEDKYYY